MTEWIAFALLTTFWGASFLWIKLALQESSPDLVVVLRLTLGFLSLFVYFLYRKESWPRGKLLWAKICGLSLLTPVLPFFLITWAETRVSSATAALLNGTVPLFAFVGAHLFIAEEKLRSRRSLIGLLIGFVGLF